MPTDNLLRYLLDIGIPENDARASIAEGALVPSQDRLKNYLRWYLLTSYSRIGNQVSLYTVGNSKDRLLAFIQRETGNQLSNV